MKNKTPTCKQLIYNMLGDLSIKTSEGHNPRTLQYNAQMINPTMYRPKACQNSGHNVLRWLHGKQENHVQALAHKQGIRHNSQTQ